MINRASKSDQPRLNAISSTGAGGNIPGADSDRSLNSDVLAFELLQTNLGRDAAFEVLDSFICFARTSIDDLRHCAGKQNAEQVRSLTKELGSSCRVVGASSLLRSCLLLEEELQDPEWHRVRLYIDAVAFETKAISQEMRHLLS